LPPHIDTLSASSKAPKSPLNEPSIIESYCDEGRETAVHSHFQGRKRVPDEKRGDGSTTVQFRLTDRAARLSECDVLHRGAVEAPGGRRGAVGGVGCSLMPSSGRVALAGLLGSCGRVARRGRGACGRRRRAAPAVRGPGGRARPRRRGACRGVKYGEALSGGVSTLCHTGARAGVVGGCLLAAVCWMRGHAMPTGGGT